MEDKTPNINQAPPKFTDPKVRPDKIWKAVVLIAVCAVVFGTVGYFAGRNKSEDVNKVAVSTQTPDITSASKTATSTTVGSATATATADANAWKKYTNSKYGFALTFGDLWKNYQVKEEASSEGPNVIALKVHIPTSDKTWSSTETDWTPFIISVYTPSEWATASAQEGPIPTLLGQNDNYVITYSSAQAAPSDGFDVFSDLKNVVSTFKFTN